MKRWCWYCEHRGERFRLFGSEGHIHCCHPDPDIAFGPGEHDGEMPFSGWPSLRRAYESCREWKPGTANEDISGGSAVQ